MFFPLASGAKDLITEAKAKDLTSETRPKGLTSKRLSVRPHLEGETPKTESSGGETSTCMGRIVQGAKRLGGETSRQGAKRP